MVTFLCTVNLDVDLDLIIGVVLNLGMVLVRADIPTVVVMERDEESKMWLERAMYKMNRAPEAVVVRVRGLLNILTLGRVKMHIEYTKFLKQVKRKRLLL